jgi:hypothetical protein
LVVDLEKKADVGVGEDGGWGGASDVGSSGEDELANTVERPKESLLMRWGLGRK